jgi:DNA gyrase/topoisomerase IV subunit A
MKLIPTSDYILDTSRDYAIYVCDQRAIPLVTDGFKSGQRKMLWLMRNKADKIKTVSLAGESISSGLYLHGDTSASQTISLMAAPYCNNIPLFHGIGTFGTRVNPTAIGAPRYTYVKRSKAAESIVYQDIDVVPLKENYDGSTMEPATFLPIIPTVLLNGVSGIAVGWSTDILPHSLNDLVDAVSQALEGKKIKPIKPCYSYLDVDVQHIEDNAWEFRGKFERLDKSTIKVKSLPPDLSLEKFRSRLDDFEEEGKIVDYTDNSAEEIDIVIKFRRGQIGDWTDESIIDLLKLKTRKSERIVVLGFDGNSIKQYSSPEELIKDWVDWRFTFYVKRYEKLLGDTAYDLLYWLGLKACFDNNLLAKLLKAKNKAEVTDHISKMTVDLDVKQIDKIASLPTYRWNKEYYEEVKVKIAEEEEKLEKYLGLLDKPDDIKDIFKLEVQSLKKLKLTPI